MVKLFQIYTREALWSLIVYPSTVMLGGEGIREVKVKT